jgi:hypothetical protein
MKRVLQELNTTTVTQLKKEFSEVSELFESLLIPFTLRAVGKDGQIIKFQESETSSIKDDYESFKVSVRQLIRTTTTFVQEIHKNKAYLLDDGFIVYINRMVVSALSLYTDVWKKVKEEDAALFTKIKNAYFTYLMLARILNTAIHYYNQSHQDHQLSQIANLPEPQYYDIGEDISAFLSEFINTINKYLE